MGDKDITEPNQVGPAGAPETVAKPEGVAAPEGVAGPEEAGEGEVKHPLQSTWCLWFFKNDKTKRWDENLQKVATFSSVEDFWSLYNFVQPASGIPPGCDYCLFREGVKPMWEDPANKAGGRWLVNLTRQQRMHSLDGFWLETLLCLIGEAFDEVSDEVNGAVVQLRSKGDKLAIWTGAWGHNEAIMRIGRKLKERLGLPTTITYQSHEDTMSKTGSMAKNAYVL